MDIPVDKIRKVQKIAKEPVSADTPVGDNKEDGSFLGDFIVAHDTEEPIDSATHHGLKDAIKEMLEQSFSQRSQSTKNAIWNQNEY